MPDTTLSYLRESRWHPVDITDDEAMTVAALGKSLAGQSTWWGESDSSDAEISKDSSAVHVRRSQQGGWEVRAVDAVGVIRVGEKVLAVRPKIPGDHVLRLLAVGGAIPRVASSPVNLETGEQFFDLLARWLVGSSEDVLRGDLIREYSTRDEELPYVRGRIDVRRTSLRLLGGRIEMLCEFDELDVDNAINRVLRAAIRVVTRSPLAQATTRTRANRLLGHFTGVADLQPEDLKVRVGPRTWYYEQALSLAKLVLRGTAFDLAAGETSACAFLIRTPEAVEAGIRALLASRLEPDHVVTNKRLPLHPSAKTLNPDLVFDGGRSVGDVKYQLQGGDWETAHLYQAVAFATGYRAPQALVITFTTGPGPRPSLQVGDVRLTNLCWDARPGITCEEAADALTRDVRAWLSHRDTVPSAVRTG
ncbi:McrC family protein [Nocardioides zeicaulis]|uniref:McrC family protein n=1 Tax=Nocardioides zeicaulis TaxID=1776857 RepID=A0ABV6E6Y6_9ACTN